MSNPLYTLDFKGASPLQVFDGAGNIMFDARYGCMRVEQRGSVGIGPRFFSPSFGSDAWVQVNLARPRASNQAAIWAAVSYGVNQLGNQLARDYSVPTVHWNAGSSQGQMQGWLAFAYPSYMRFVNSSPAGVLNLSGYDGSRTVYYCIFDGSVSI